MIDEQRYRALIQQLATGGITGNKNYNQYESMNEESMGYMNGGGIGTMMQPRQNYARGGDIEQSDFGLQNIINYDLPGNQNTQTAGFFSSDAENALENIDKI